MAPTKTELKALSLAEVLEAYPASKAVLSDFNLLAYAETKTASLESIEASAIVNQIDLDTFLTALEAVI
jgi:hypothetical protein